MHEVAWAIRCWYDNGNMENIRSILSDTQQHKPLQHYAGGRKRGRKCMTASMLLENFESSIIQTDSLCCLYLF
jgi:rRNA pseudouridine-1189 N-methylase Emg1 (Nep1/Mra1 family)